MAMIITCRWVQDRILLYLAGELDPRLATRLAEHLEHCGRCTRAAEEIAEAQEVIATGALRIPVPPTPQTLDTRVLTAIKDLPVPGGKGTEHPLVSRLLRPGLALVTAALLVSLGFGLGRWIPSRSAPPIRTTGEVLELTAVAHHDAALRRAGVPVTIAGTDVVRVTAALQPQVSFRIMPINLSAAGARLLGARQCSLGERCNAAVLIYDWGGERVTLYETDARHVSLPEISAPAAFPGNCFLVGERDGASYALWRNGTTNFVLVAHTPAQRLLRLASAARSEAAA